jgi:hypothetical protein
MPFCNKCGVEVLEGVNFCGECANSLAGGQSPTQRTITSGFVAVNRNNGEVSAWNPSIMPFFVFLCPPLGVILQHINWKSLGMKERQSISMIWIVVAFIMIPVTAVILSMVFGVKPDEAIAIKGIIRFALVSLILQYGLYFLFTIIWYYGGGGKDQVKYVKEALFEYRKKSWEIPIVVLVGGVPLLGVMLGLAFG